MSVYICMYISTGFPHYLKVCFTPLHFYEEPVFTNQNKSKEDYCFYEMVIASLLYTILSYKSFHRPLNF